MGHLTACIMESISDCRVQVPTHSNSGSGGGGARGPCLPSVCLSNGNV